MDAASGDQGCGWSIRLPWALGLACLSGVLYVAAFPGPGLWPLGFVALVPLLVALRGRSPGAGFLVGLTAGTLCTGLGFAWLLETLVHHSGLPRWLCLVVFGLLSLAQGGRLALLGWLHARGVQNGWPRAAVFASAFAASEILYPLVFPWYFGAILHPLIPLIQVADLGGMVLVSLVLVSANLAIEHLVHLRLSRHPISRPLMSACLGAFVLAIGYGGVRIVQIDARTANAPSIRIGLVQGNLPMSLRSEQLDGAMKTQVALTHQLREQGVELTIWAESAFPYPLSDGDGAKLVGEVVRRDVGGPFLFGAIAASGGSDQGSLLGAGPAGRLHNSAFITNAEGAIVGRYDKNHLLPFGEYLPWEEQFPSLRKLSPASGRFARGATLRPLPFEDKRISVSICYEDILPSFISETMDHGRSHLLVNLTNDGWFGDGWEPRMHLALSKFRAVEHHRTLIRATNTGVSAIVDPVGRVIGQTGTFREATLVRTVRWGSGRTLYEMWGDMPAYALSMLAVVAALLRRRGVRAE